MSTNTRTTSLTAIQRDLQQIDELTVEMDWIEIDPSDRTEQSEWLDIYSDSLTAIQMALEKAYKLKNTWTIIDEPRCYKYGIQIYG